MSEKKQVNSNQKPCEHVYFPCESTTTGGRISVIQVRCSKCLHLVALDKLKWVEPNEDIF